VWLQQPGDGADSGAAGTVSFDSESRDEEQAETAIVCARCRQAITADKHRIIRGGAHRHTQMNPHGYFYTVLCFAEARGLTLVGVPSAEWSWFDGFAWIIVDCAGCGRHLGWRFIATADAPDDPPESFYGLIEERLREGG